MAIQALGIISGVILARALGPSARGEVAAVILWPAFLATIGNLGLPDALTFQASRATAPARTVLATGLTLALVLSVFTVLAALLVFPVVFAQHPASTLTSAYLYLVYIPTNLITLTFLAVLNGLGRFRSFQACRVLVIACTTGGLVALAVAESVTVTSVVAVNLVANFITAATAGVLVSRDSALDLRPSLPLTKELLRYGLQSHLGTLASSLNVSLDQLLISVFMAPAKLGLYVVAVTLTAPISLVGASVAMVALPYVAALKDPTIRATAARRLASLTLVMSMLCAIPLIAIAPLLIQIFFGSAYLGATGVARILIVATVALSSGRALSAILKAVGRPFDAGLGDIAAAVTTIVSLAIFLPLLDITGAAIASFVAYSVSFGWLARRAALSLGLPLGALLIPSRAELGWMADRLFRRRACSRRAS